MNAPAPISIASDVRSMFSPSIVPSTVSVDALPEGVFAVPKRSSPASIETTSPAAHLRTDLAE